MWEASRSTGTIQQAEVGNEYGYLLGPQCCFYVAAITFHFTLMCTDVGNYLHVGTVGGLVAVQSGAALIAVLAIKIFPKAGLTGWAFIVLCALIPLLFLIASLGYGIGSLISTRTWAS